MELIEDKTLLRLNMYILATRYLEKGAYCIVEVTKDNKKANEDGRKAKTVSNLEEETKKKGFT